MNKIRIGIGIMALAFSLTVHAQQDAKAKAETKRLTELAQKLEGTYQLQVIDSREKVAMPMSILDSVETKRQLHETVYFWMKKNIRVMVLPKSELLKPGFKGIERITYISSKNLAQ